MGRQIDWYRSVGRPVFFALPPEAAHRLARGLLGLPLPWKRLGGAERYPALRVELAGIDLANPVGLAAGFDKAGTRTGNLGRLGFGYVVCGTFSRRARRGHPKPRIVRYPRRGSILNAMGLPNPGAEAAARYLGRAPRTSPRIASIADEDLTNVLETHAILEPHVDAIELNASCPNVAWGRDRDNEAHLRSLMRGLGARRSRPLFVKLPPFRTDVERDVVLVLASIAQDEGADGLTVSNTVPAKESRLALGVGGLSGRTLLAGTVANVHEIHRATGGALPVNASGGIFTRHDALRCIEAGATTVQIYSALVYRGPRVVGELTRGIADEIRRRGVRLAELARAG